MGYEFTYKLKPEHREMLKKEANFLCASNSNATDGIITDACSDIVFNLMKPERADISSMRFYIRLSLECIYCKILGKLLATTAENSDDDSFFCGWNLANLTAEDEGVKTNHICDDNVVVTDMLKLAVLVPTPDYFDSPDNFNSKFEEINALVTEFRDYAEEKAIEYVVIKLKQMGAEITYDEGDDIGDDCDNACSMIENKIENI